MKPWLLFVVGSIAGITLSLVPFMVTGLDGFNFYNYLRIYGFLLCIFGFFIFILVLFLSGIINLVLGFFLKRKKKLLILISTKKAGIVVGLMSGIAFLSLVFF